MREIEYRLRAEIDIDGTITYQAVVLGSSSAARATADAIFSAIERVAMFPESGKPVFDDALEQGGYRKVLAKRHWIYFTYSAETLTVWRVVHETQDVDEFGFDVFEDR